MTNSLAPGVLYRSEMQSKPVNTAIEYEYGGESDGINGVSVLSALNIEKCKSFLSPRTKQTVCSKY